MSKFCSSNGEPLMSYTPQPKAAKLVWANQLIRLHCLVVYVKFQFVFTIRLNYS